MGTAAKATASALFAYEAVALALDYPTLSSLCRRDRRVEAALLVLLAVHLHHVQREALA